MCNWKKNYRKLRIKTFEISLELGKLNTPLALGMLNGSRSSKKRKQQRTATTLKKKHGQF